jgi:hypothetical protein
MGKEDGERMRIKNLRNKTLVFGNIYVEPDEEKDVPDTEAVRALIKNGYVYAKNVKLQEKSGGWTIESLKEKKEKLGWKEFQKWAFEKFGVKDTDENELYKEILEVS